MDLSLEGKKGDAASCSSIPYQQSLGLTSHTHLIGGVMACTCCTSVNVSGTCLDLFSSPLQT